MQQQEEEEVKGEREREGSKWLGGREEKKDRMRARRSGGRDDRISQHESKGDRNPRSMVEWIYATLERERERENKRRDPRRSFA